MDWDHYDDVQQSRRAGRETTVQLSDGVDRDQPFVFRFAGGFYAVAAATGLLSSAVAPNLSGLQRLIGVVLSFGFGGLSAYGMLNPSGLARTWRAHRTRTVLIALGLQPLFILPVGGYASPVRIQAAMLVCSAAGLLTRRGSLLFGAAAAVVDLVCVLALNTPAEIDVQGQLGYELVLVPANLLAAGFVGSLFGEASLLTRSLEETLSREARRLERLREALARMRADVVALVALLPPLVVRARETCSTADADEIEAAARRTASRARDVRWATIEADGSSRDDLASDLRDVVAYYEHLILGRDVTVNFVARDAASIGLEQRSQNHLRVVLGRALENIHDAGTAKHVRIELLADDDGSIVLEVEDDGGPPEAVVFGRGSQHSLKLMRQLGGRYVAATTAHGVRVRAEVPGHWAAGSATRPVELVTERVRELFGLALRATRWSTIPMVLASLWIDSQNLTDHRIPSAIVASVLMGVTEAIDWRMRRDNPARSAQIRTALAIGVALWLAHGDRHPLGGWAGITMVEMLWYAGVRQYAFGAAGLMFALIASYKPLPGVELHHELRAVLIEGIWPALWGLPVWLMMRVIAAVQNQERNVRSTADRAQFLGEIAYEVSESHGLIMPIELTVAARLPSGPHRDDVLRLVNAIRTGGEDEQNTLESEDSLVQALAHVIAHRAYPARVTVVDYRPVPDLFAGAADEAIRRQGRRSTALGVFASAAEHVVTCVPPGALGAWRLEEVRVTLQADEDDHVEILITPVPTTLRRSAVRTLLDAQLDAAGGERLDGFDDNVIHFRLPAMTLA